MIGSVTHVPRFVYVPHSHYRSAIDAMSAQSAFGWFWSTVTMMSLGLIMVLLAVAFKWKAPNVKWFLIFIPIIQITMFIYFRNELYPYLYGQAHR